MLTTLIIFIIILGVLIFAHELGHFVTARIFGAKAEEFGFGYPPRICGWKKINGKRKFFWGNKPTEEIDSEDTILSLNWLPLGGFVKIKGEDGQDKQDEESFGSKKAWKRGIILSAGVFMNIVLAMILLSVAFMVGAPQVIDSADQVASVQDAKVQVIQIMADSPAQAAGLTVGDELLAVDANEVKQLTDVEKYINLQADSGVTVQINRYGEIKEIEIIPRFNEASQKYEIGVALVKTGLVSYPWYQAIWLGIKSAILLTGQIIIAFYQIIKNLLVGLPAGVEVAGPVGIAVMTGQVASLGFVYLLQFAAILSINLAIINFLPFPALDGGRVLFLIIEKIRRKPVPQKIEQIIHALGYLLLILLVVIITGRDIYKFKDMFINFFTNIVK